MAQTRPLTPKYARRIASAEARGLSRSQARGHARAGEAPIKAPKSKTDDQLEAALKVFRQTKDRTAAAKFVGVSPERFRRFLHEIVQVEGRGRTSKITDRRVREMTVISDGTVSTIRLRDFEEASLNGEHRAAVKAFLSTNDIDVLAPFVGRSVFDDRGAGHPLETNPNTLHRLAHAGDQQFHEIYRLVL